MSNWVQRILVLHYPKINRRSEQGHNAFLMTIALISGNT